MQLGKQKFAWRAATACKSHSCGSRARENRQIELEQASEPSSKPRHPPKPCPPPPPPPRAEKPARQRAPWTTWHRTSAVFAPRQIEAGGATPAARMGGCGRVRALEIRRVFENRFTTSNVMAEGPRSGLSGSLRYVKWGRLKSGGRGAEEWAASSSRLTTQKPA